ncbi:GNAT family N-acetyltransferase [Streptomyces sp. NPDC046870]|uniref:GNAT family N-acetyltransferase n=1 Tax=Streptomyces sp. NPDC046870 TaxID=3155135 RepID=UPI003452ACFD
MDLLPCAPVHAALVAGWPTSAAEAVMWCGSREFPVAAETVAGWQQADDVEAHVLVDGRRVLGYGEVWRDAEEDEAELARIIVAPGARGAGLGRLLVQGLLARAVRAGFTDVSLRVHPGNDRALRCYLGAGFRPVSPELAASWNTAQPVDYVWLRHDSGAPHH